MVLPSAFATVRRAALALSLLFITVSSWAQTPAPPPSFLVPTPRAKQWADSVFNMLTPDERIAQLIMVAGYSNRNGAYEDSLATLVRVHRLGGVVMFQGGPVRHAKLVNRLQALSAVPLLIAIDGEWGLGMRLDSTVRFPYQMTLGGMAGQDDLIYQMGADMARQCKRLGIHINFAPVVDVNNNPNNPVINFRAFGEDKYAVTRKGLAYMRGMQDNRLMTSIKHFPGHGDTGVDSHYDLPVIAKSRAQLDSLELYPFRELINAGAAGVMVSHLSIPALDSARNFPATLSSKILTNLLRDELGFQGLTFSDAMNMKGLTKFYPAGVSDRMAVEAGMDVLEFTEDVPRAIAEIKQAITEGRITQASINARCMKVLLAKAWVGLDAYKPTVLDNLVADLNQPQSELINRKLIEASLTVLKNDGNLLPLRNLDSLRIATVALEAPTPTAFQQMAGNYTQIDHFNLTSAMADTTLARIQAQLANYNLLLVDVHLSNIRPGARYGMQAKTAALVQQLAATDKAVITVFGNAYAIDKLPGIDRARALVMPYQLTPMTEELSAQLIFGAIGASGRLPVTVNSQYKLGAGITTFSLGRLKYTIPEEVGISSAYLAQQVDSVVNAGLQAKAYPGCVVQMAKDGKVIYRKAYGQTVFAEPLGQPAVAITPRPVRLDDLYDMASVTKISTSTPALMRLVDLGLFDVDATMSAYLPGYKRSNKANLVWRDVLTHQARLRAWIPFWRETKNEDGSFKPKTFSNVRSRRYPIEVTDSLFLHRSYPDRIFEEIKDSPLNEKKAAGESEYVYSDLSFYLYPQIVKRLAGEDFEEFLKKTFYRPLGATTLTYKPRLSYPLNRIVPTEYDSLFRKTLIWGRVHDEGAAMLDGLSGHAGLFGSANDLMKLMEMYRQRGSYGGRQYLSPAVLTEFTRYQFPELGNRRGLGFEKPAYKYNANAPRSASASSFGHSGFTGTFTWVDPAYNLTYVFLSNRVYPTRENNKISSMNIRTNVMEALYKAMKRGI
ncbi:glycoside hydrolase family 3 N-terminal domain-containing protein [Rudanella paleaurantiibacter]|nr:glycoside hydrolase family 3 N-terminal domain-containing protein [Rudanella paleaurantiibacter]